MDELTIRRNLDAARKELQQITDAENADLAARLAAMTAERDRLRSALRAFVDYYTQAGIGDCSEADEDAADNGDRDDEFDGDEIFNVRQGRAALAPPADAGEVACEADADAHTLCWLLYNAANQVMADWHAGEATLHDKCVNQVEAACLAFEASPLSTYDAGEPRREPEPKPLVWSSEPPKVGPAKPYWCREDNGSPWIQEFSGPPDERAGVIAEYCPIPTPAEPGEAGPTDTAGSPPATPPSS